MAITKIPGVYLNEEVDYELSGTGSKIPIWIGLTGNTGTASYKVDGTSIMKFTQYDDLNKATTAGGIGAVTGDTSTNTLNLTLKQFFKESALKQVDDIGVPYIYVIDVGDGTDKDAWLNAIETALSKNDADLLAFVGTENITNYSVVDLMKATRAALETRTTTFEIFNAFFTKKDATDEQLIALTDATNGIQKSRIGVVEWDDYRYGKSIARICLTPYSNEVGFLPYRSVEPGTFPDRTSAEKLALQNAGIIFNHDEIVNDAINPRMNLCLATSFAATNKPADSMFHARFIADEVLKEIYEVAYPFIKANDTATNLVKLQVKVDTVVDSFIREGECVAWNKDTGLGTRLIVQESDKNPYDIEIVGSIQPVNAIIAINVREKINTAALYNGGS